MKYRIVGLKDLGSNNFMYCNFENLIIGKTGKFEGDIDDNSYGKGTFTLDKSFKDPKDGDIVKKLYPADHWFKLERLKP